ncbi:MAG: TRAP transporter large permease [Planctomycetota bacterium]|jgi:tripartite ATP-independent transporter DctM subunit|nr:TRAP transporter large permease [Planctomycetota bacterium]
MELFVFLGSLFGFLITGLPIAIVLIICSIILLHYIEMYDPMLLAHQMISGTDNYVLVTVPFFILAGELMKHGGISKQLITFAELVVGRFRGGMGYVTVLACMLFAGLSGIAIADVSALGSILIPMMVAIGYRKDRATGLVCSAALTAPIIPPSLPMIILGVTVELSIGRLFVMGIVPGILLGFTVMSAWFIMVRRDGYHDVKTVSLNQVWPIFIKAFPSLMLPVIIIVGIRLGFFTPTEGGAIACVYAFFVAVIINRELKLHRLPAILYDGIKSSAAVMFIVGGACTIGWLITMADVPAQLIERMQGLVQHPMLLLIVLNILFLLLGMVMDITPIILIFAPVIFPLIRSAGIDPYYFALVMIINLCIGLITPPVGTVLFVGCSVSNLKMGEVVKGILPFLLAELIFLVACISFPRIITWPATWFGYNY